MGGLYIYILGKWKDVLLTHQYFMLQAVSATHTMNKPLREEASCHVCRKYDVYRFGKRVEATNEYKWPDVLHCVTVMYVTCHLKVFMCFSCMKNTFGMFYLVCWIRFVKCQVSSIYRSLFGTSQTCWLMVEVVQMRSSDHKNLWNNPKFYHGPMIGIAKYKHVS